MINELTETSPVRPLEEVVIAGGEEKHHRAWPSLATATDGCVVAAYKVGPDHHMTDQGVLWVARSEDGGRTWPVRRPVAVEPGWDTYTHHGLTRLSDGTLLLPVVRGRHIGEDRKHYFSRGRFTRSRDGGALWEEWGAELEFPFVSPSGRGMPYGRIHELPGGRLMVPFYGTPRDASDPKHRVLAVVFSADGGDTWNDSTILHAGKTGDICPSETDIVDLPDGRYLAIVRANAQKRLYRSYSGDEGRSWTALEPTEMPGQCPALLRLASGALFCAYRDMTEGGAGMSCAVSSDQGKSWEILGYLYRGSNSDCAYPSMASLPDGRIYCAFYTSAEPVSGTGSCEIHGIIMEDRSR